LNKAKCVGDVRMKLTMQASSHSGSSRDGARAFVYNDQGNNLRSENRGYY